MSERRFVESLPPTERTIYRAHAREMSRLRARLRVLNVEREDIGERLQRLVIHQALVRMQFRY